MSQKMKTFVIHLARSTGRREQVEHLLNATPYAAEILDAVDGALVPDDEIAALYSRDPLFKPAYPFALSLGEIGCFMSHRRAWQRIVDEDLDGALIIEDDVAIDAATFTPAVKLAAKNLGTLGYVQFQVRPIKTATQVAVQEGQVALVTPRVVPLRTSAQMVSNAAAKELLQRSQRFDRPVDVFAQMPWITGVGIACAMPSGVSDKTQETGGSTIQISKGKAGQLSREVNRVIYRAKISRMSKKHCAF